MKGDMEDLERGRQHESASGEPVEQADSIRERGSGAADAGRGKKLPDSEGLSDAEREKRDLMESLERRVETMNSFRRVISEIESRGLRGSEAGRHLRDGFDGLRSEMEVRSDAVLIFGSLQRQLEDLERTDVYSAGQDAREEAAIRRGNLVREIKELSENPEVALIKSLDGMVGDLSFKAAKVDDCRSYATSQLLRSAELGKYNFSSEDVSRIEFGTFEITIYLKPDARPDMVKEWENTEGVKLPRSPFLLIKDRQGADTEETKSHEKTHNYVEGARLGDSLDIITRRLAGKLGDAKRETADGREVVRFVQESALSFSAASALDAIKEDVLAEIPHVESAWREGDEAYRRPVGVKGVDDLAGLADRYADRFRTAGDDFKNYLSLLDRIIGVDPESQTSTKIAEKKKHLIRDFVGMTHGLIDAFGLADNIGQQAKDDVHSLVAVLRPSHYRHISKYLEQKYPDQIKAAKEKISKFRKLISKMDRSG